MSNDAQLRRKLKQEMNSALDMLSPMQVTNWLIEHYLDAAVALEGRMSNDRQGSATFRPVEDRDSTIANLRDRLAEMEAALERTLENFKRLLASKPVRDASETIAEAESVLREKKPEPLGDRRKEGSK